MSAASVSVDLEQIAADAVARARAAGATGSECTITEGDEFSVSVRMREIESIKEAGSRAAGIRVLVGQRTGSSYTSDLSPDGIAKMVHAAMDLAKVTTEDPHAGLPDSDRLGKISQDLQLYDDNVEKLEAETRIAMAESAERAALDFDPRISNSEGAGFSSYSGRRVFANSLGFVGSYRDRKSTRLNSSHTDISRMPSSA